MKPPGPDRVDCEIEIMAMRSVVLAAVLSSAAAFTAPAPRARPLARSKVASSSVAMDVSADGATRRGVLAAGVAFMGASLNLAPAGAAADYSLSKDYLVDAQNLMTNMRFATNLTRGAPGFEDTVVATRKEMNDFVSYYRRQARYSGAQSFNTIYTAINTLAGHYASYGNTYPVPSKRRERLTVQYKEIEKCARAVRSDSRGAAGRTRPRLTRGRPPLFAMTRPPRAQVSQKGALSSRSGPAPPDRPPQPQPALRVSPSLPSRNCWAPRSRQGATPLASGGVSWRPCTWPRPTESAVCRFDGVGRRKSAVGRNPAHRTAPCGVSVATRRVSERCQAIDPRHTLTDTGDSYIFDSPALPAASQPRAEPEWAKGCPRRQLISRPRGCPAGRPRAWPCPS